MQNLGDEGTAYVVETLAFNTNCFAVDLGKNGMGNLGMMALCQVLPTCMVQTLALSTNSIGDSGSETLAKVLSGESPCVGVTLDGSGEPAGSETLGLVVAPRGFGPACGACVCRIPVLARLLAVALGKVWEVGWDC